MSRLTSQPESINVRASQSRSSGCDGKLSLAAEILGRRDDPAAEECLPPAVDRDAGRQRMLRAPSATAPGPSRLRGHESFKRRQAGRRARLDPVAGAS